MHIRWAVGLGLVTLVNLGFDCGGIVPPANNSSSTPSGFCDATNKCSCDRRTVDAVCENFLTGALIATTKAACEADTLPGSAGTFSGVKYCDVDANTLGTCTRHIAGSDSQDVYYADSPFYMDSYCAEHACSALAGSTWEAHTFFAPHSRGSCTVNNNDFSSCADYIGNNWGSQTAMAQSCEGTFATTPCPAAVLGSCRLKACASDDTVTRIYGSPAGLNPAEWCTQRGGVWSPGAQP